ncbi:unnamed protein product [Kuraishia capsulata CBS 1993]|uniref:Ubiquitin carboxyl-terminal hydrolase n=1 Tax=Kuraishia capsulata CBS 1993 TaxID=1382522 RepID=W6MUH2_9ASCO|nr:uncharacterized protein KUCA_T00001590001 [Kuraishia capsulata CBS 1993]CDK25620.1 unnamed protein product [Kuraishia capsulata CBS 1993]
MFKKWKAGSDNKPKAKETAPVQTEKPAAHPASLEAFKDDALHIEVSHEEETDPELEYRVVTQDLNVPYGDGSDKIFGMENFGNTCYCNSILQCLFYTVAFRRAVLTFPERDPVHRRKRKLKVNGTKPHAFVLGTQPLSQQSQTQAQSQPTSNGKDEKKRRSSIFALKNEPASSAVPAAPAASATHTTSQPLNIPILNFPNVERYLVSRWPSFADLNIKFALNQQKNITIVGIVGDPNANSEQRKRQALMRGPIVNLDQSFNMEYGMDQSLYTALKDVFECMAENNSHVGVVSPQKLIEVLKRENELFRSSMHQDAHEFINFLINTVLEVVDRMEARTSQHSNLHGIFEGLLTSETRCLSCENVSTRDEKFLDLSIDLQQNSSITNCLKMFSQSEMLNESNKFYCEKCHSLQEAAKTIKLKKLPQVLVLHLKRFKYMEELNRNMKLFYRVEYPKNLRVFNTTDDAAQPDKLYELYGVVVHIGGGPYHGHYVSLIKTEKFGWLLFDDETVESIDEDYVFRFFGDGPGLATAYVLFYQEISEEEFLEKNLYDGFEDELETEGDSGQTSRPGSQTNINNSGDSNDNLSGPQTQPSTAPTSAPVSAVYAPVEKPEKHEKEKKKRIFSFKK